MANYPFDHQSCEIILINKDNEDNTIELIQDTLAYSGPTDVSQYIINEVHFVPRSNSVIVKIDLSRRMQNVILNTFLPTAIIILVIIFVDTYYTSYILVLYISLTYFRLRLQQITITQTLISILQ